MICVSKRSRNRFPPEREACWGPDGGYLGRFGGNSGPGLICDTKQSREQSVDDVRFTVKCNICPPPSSDPPDSDPVNLFRSDSFKHAALRAAVQHTWRTVHTTERPSAKQPVTRPNIFLDTICYIFSSLWTQSFPHENFPVHSFIRLSEHTFPHFCTHKSHNSFFLFFTHSCFQTWLSPFFHAFCPVSIFWTEWFFFFVFLKHNNEHLEAAGIVWMQPVMPLLTPETHVWY